MLVEIHNANNENVTVLVSFRSGIGTHDAFFSQRVLHFQDGLVRSVGRAGFGVDRAIIEFRLENQKFSFGPTMSVVPGAAVWPLDFAYELTLEPGPQHFAIAAGGPGSWVKIEALHEPPVRVAAEVVLVDAHMAPWLFTHTEDEWDVAAEVWTAGGGLVHAAVSLDLRHSHREVYAFAASPVGDVWITDASGSECRRDMSLGNIAWLVQPPAGALRVDALVAEVRGPAIAMVVVTNVPLPPSVEERWCRQFGEGEPPTPETRQSGRIWALP